MALTEPIRDPADVYRFLNYFKTQNHPRNYVLAAFGVHTALRISDILNLTTSDVYDFAKGTPRKTITITEKKTKKPKIIALNKTIIAALKMYLPYAAPGAPLMLNPQTGKAISRIQAYRIIRSAAEATGISHPVSCHSLRKTFGYHAFKNGISPVIIMRIYNHSSMHITQRYLGLQQDHLNTAYLNMDFTTMQNSRKMSQWTDFSSFNIFRQ